MRIIVEMLRDALHISVDLVILAYVIVFFRFKP